MAMVSIAQQLQGNSYPGRGIILGRTPDGKNAVCAYFIMGRSENSRNRVFVQQGTDLRTEPCDPAKCSDPSLIIYSPVRVLGNKTIVSNGDQTDTIYEALDHQFTFEQALRARTFEPDAPNYTPRISGIIRCEKGHFNYALSIIKSADGSPESCRRFTFTYQNPLPGQGHFIHTYQHDGSPLPSFEGEPKLISIPDDIEGFTDLLWSSLDPENKISLFVRFINPENGDTVSKVVNKYQKI